MELADALLEIAKLQVMVGAFQRRSEYAHECELRAHGERDAAREELHFLRKLVSSIQRTPEELNELRAEVRLEIVAEEAEKLKSELCSCEQDFEARSADYHSSMKQVSRERDAYRDALQEVLSAAVPLEVRTPEFCEACSHATELILRRVPLEQHSC